jgi:hypothetical protein
MSMRQQHAARCGRQQTYMLNRQTPADALPSNPTPQHTCTHMHQPLVARAMR